MNRFNFRITQYSLIKFVSQFLTRDMSKPDRVREQCEFHGTYSPFSTIPHNVLIESKNSKMKLESKFFNFVERKVVSKIIGGSG